MSDWTARIDALLAERPDPFFKGFEGHEYELRVWNERRLALAAERLREPHDKSCRIGGHETRDGYAQFACTCGKDADLARILEGK